MCAAALNACSQLWTARLVKKMSSVKLWIHISIECYRYALVGRDLLISGKSTTLTAFCELIIDDEYVWVHFLSFVFFLFHILVFCFCFSFWCKYHHIYVCIVWKSLSIRLSVTLSSKMWKLHEYLFIYEQAIFETLLCDFHFFLRRKCLIYIVNCNECYYKWASEAPFSVCSRGKKKWRMTCNRLIYFS